MNKNIKDIILIIVIVSIIYLLGFITAILIINNRESEKTTRLKIELKNKEEIIYQLDLEKNRLESIIYNYTIEERKGK